MSQYFSKCKNFVRLESAEIKLLIWLQTKVLLLKSLQVNFQPEYRHHNQYLELSKELVSYSPREYSYQNLCTKTKETGFLDRLSSLKRWFFVNKIGFWIAQRLSKHLAQKFGIQISDRADQPPVETNGVVGKTNCISDSGITYYLQLAI
ncbi:MAG: hypothetical protein ACHBN1_27160 [Heteroscytonema crispum UTEX LB 1556]